MEKFTLESVYHIAGIGAASGLLLHKNSLYIISDNSGFLYKYNLLDEKLESIPLFENAASNIPKSEKPDFESISLKGNELYLFGSGSTNKRNFSISYNLENQKTTRNDRSAFYKKMRNAAALSEQDFNIEGTLFYNGKWFFFQRGNGGNNSNGIFILENLNNENIDFHPIILPKIGSVNATFTDATLVNNKIFFLAAAEDTASTYNDGEILGSLYGIINPETLDLEHTEIISNKNKFEGIAFLENSTDFISFFLCEDSDNDIRETDIYKLTIAK